jgi:excisionase family DNA binding protein
MEINNSQPRAMTVREVASHLNVCRQTVAAMIQRGDLRAIRLGRSVRIPTSELDRLLATGRPD